MEREMLTTLLQQNIDYLCEVYQFAQEKYFIAYVDGDEEGMKYYKEIFDNIGEELRKRNYWRY